MRKRIAAFCVIAIACASTVAGCRKGESEAPSPKAATAQPAVESGDTNFSPPEIRRPMPQDTDSISATSGTPASIPAPTKPVATVAPDKGKPAASAVAAQPAPVAKAQPKPAPAAPPPAPRPAPAPPSSATSTTSADPGPDGEWVLQVNVAKSESEASAQVAKLASEGVSAYSVVVPTEGGGLAGRYWRVRVGRFKSRAEAQSYGEAKILPRGLKFWIDRKSNETRMVGGN